MSKSILDKPSFNKLVDILGKDSGEKGHKGRVVFFELQLLTALVTSIFFCNDSPPTFFNDMERCFEFTEFIIGISDILAAQSQSESNDEEGLLEEIVSFIITGFMFPHSQQFRYLIPRSFILFNELPDRDELKTSPNRIDFRGLFKKYIGINLSRYMSICFGILSNWKTVTFYDKDPAILANFTLDTRTYFRNTHIEQDEYEKVITLLSIDKEAISREILFDTTRKSFPYDMFLLMKRRPIFKIAESRYIPFSLKYFEEYMTAGIYWLLEEQIEKNEGKEERERFTVFFGEVFELYIYEAIRRIIESSGNGSIYFKKRYKKGRDEVEATDIILAINDTALFIEVKSGRLRMIPTVVEGDIESFKEYISSRLVRAAKQINRTFEDFRDGLLVLEGIDPKDVKKIIPVFISLEPLPLHEPTWMLIEEAIKEEGLLIDVVFERFQILNCEEVEIIEAIVASSDISLVGILREHARSTYKNRSIKNFLHYDTDYSEGQGNACLLVKYKEIQDSIAKALFPGETHDSEPNEA